MITVNLLPADLRPVERTPLPRFLAIVVGVALGVTGLLALFVLYFNKLPDVHQRIASYDDTIKALEVQAAEFTKVKRELNSILQREAAVQAMYRGRTVWWKKLDQLTDLTPSFVGMTRVDFKETSARRGEAESAGTLMMDCIVAKAEEKRVARFRRILKGEVPPEWGAPADVKVGAEFIEAFVGREIQDGGWRHVESSEYPEEPAIEFTLRMRLLPKEAPALD